MARHEQYHVNRLTFEEFLDVSGNILFTTGTTVPTDSTAGYAKGCIFIDTDVGAGSNGVYINVGTSLLCNFDVQGTIGTNAVTTTTILANAVTSAKIDESVIQVAETTISSADIVGTSAGQFGHADGVVLVADPGATKVVQLISAVLIYDYAGAAYGAGSTTTVNISGGAALTGTIAAAAFCGATSDKVVALYPLSTVGVALTVNKGLNLVTGTAFTLGSATGVIRVKTMYRVITHGLA